LLSLAFVKMVSKALAKVIFVVLIRKSSKKVNYIADKSLGRKMRGIR